jgi:hypothetical protein
MMTYIARQQFNSCNFDAEDLQQATNLLAKCMIQASQAKTKNLSVQVTATIWGFTRSEAEAECVDLRERIEVSSEGASVKMANLDTIEVAFLPVPFTSETSTPNVRRIFEGVMPFEYIQKSRVITFRVNVKQESSRKRDTTVVFYGVKRGTTYTLEGIWPIAPNQMPEELFQATPWTYESNFLTLLQDYKNGIFSVPDWVTTELFAVGGPAKFNLVNWFSIPPSPKPKHFLIRLGVVSLVLLLGILAFVTNLILSLFLIIPTIFAAVILIFLIVIRFNSFFYAYNLFKDANEKLCNNPIQYPKVEIENYPKLLGDPAVEKYSKELARSRGEYLATVGIEGGVLTEGFAHIYRFEEGQTTFTLAFLGGTEQKSNSIAQTRFVLNTYFEDGWRFMTTNVVPIIQRDLGSPIRMQFFDGMDDVEEILLKHQRGVEKMIAKGHRPRILTREESLERMVQDHEESREKIKKLGYYTYWDAFLWTFDLDLLPKI